MLRVMAAKVISIVCPDLSTDTAAQLSQCMINFIPFHWGPQVRIATKIFTISEMYNIVILVTNWKCYDINFMATHGSKCLQ